MSHRFGTYKTLASALESDMLKNLKFIWNHSRKKIKKNKLSRKDGLEPYTITITMLPLHFQVWTVNLFQDSFFYFFMRKLNSFRLKLEYNKGNYKARSTSRYIHVGWLLLSKMLLIQWNYIAVYYPFDWIDTCLIWLTS